MINDIVLLNLYVYLESKSQNHFMKKMLTKILFTLLLAAGFSIGASAQLVVKIRPADPVYVRPVAPSPRHVWVEGEWTWENGQYVHHDGYWVEPRRGFHWVPGHWREAPGGWTWVPGHWRRH